MHYIKFLFLLIKMWGGQSEGKGRRRHAVFFLKNCLQTQLCEMQEHFRIQHRTEMQKNV